MNFRPVIFGVLTLGFTVSSPGANIPLSGASATFDQGGNYTIARTIDGNALDSTLGGWGIFGQTTTNQTAFWTAASAATSSSGFVFTLPQNFGNGADPHRIQRFRLSLTTDPTPSAGGLWTQLAPQALLGSGAPGNGTTFTPIGGNIFKATGGGLATYQAVVPGNFTGVTGFRLEVFPETDGNGALGASANGNFVLSQFRVDTYSNFNWAAFKQVTGSATTYLQETGGKSLPNYLTDENLLTFNHPLVAGPTPFSYTIDLGGNIDLDSLQLFARSDCCDPNPRMNDYRINILNAAQASVWQGEIHTAAGENGRIDTITEGLGTGAFEGRFVQITNIGSGTYSPQVAEVKAFGTLIPEPASGSLLLVAAGLLARRRR